MRSSPSPRPGPHRWLWYALTGRLAERFHPWAFYDLTCRTWPIRHLARLMVPVVPVFVVLALVLPGPLSVRITAGVTGMVVGLLYAFVFLHDSTDRRAMKLGYASGAAEEARQERVADQQLKKAERRFRARG
jgi:hypothetical protein